MEHWWLLDRRQRSMYMSMLKAFTAIGVMLYTHSVRDQIEVQEECMNRARRVVVLLADYQH